MSTGLHGDWSLIFACAYLALVTAVFVLDSVINPDRLSPVKFLCFFSLLDAVSLAWFAWFADLRELLIFSQLQLRHHTAAVVNVAYLLGPLGFSAACLGIYMAGLPPRHCVAPPEPAAATAGSLGSRPLIVWTVVYLLGTAAFFVWTQTQGGIVAIWVERTLAGEVLERSGYVDLLYSTLLGFGGMALYVELWLRRRPRLAIALVVLTCLVLGALGNRAPIVGFLILIAVAHNSRVSPIRRLFSLRSATVLVTLGALMYAMVNLRPGNEDFLVGPDATISERLSRDVVMRVGTLERRLVVAGHFGARELWLGQSYLALLTGPVPSSVLRFKQPVDSGVYLLALADGQTVAPQMNPAALPETSWPEGNLAGYMNFHVPGFVALSALAGWLFGLAYRRFRRDPASYTFMFIFASFAYFGGPTLSPFGVARILMTVIPALLVGWLFGSLARGPGGPAPRAPVH